MSEESAKDLTGKMMPIGTFSSRITLAYAIGLITSEEAKDLHRMREIRNRFAHRLNGLSFATQAIRDSCSNFLLVNASKEVKKNRKFFEDYPTGARSTFNLAVTLAIAAVKERIAKTTRIREAGRRNRTAA